MCNFTQLLNYIFLCGSLPLSFCLAESSYMSVFLCVALILVVLKVYRETLYVLAINNLMLTFSLPPVPCLCSSLTASAPLSHTVSLNLSSSVWWGCQGTLGNHPQSRISRQLPFISQLYLDCWSQPWERQVCCKDPHHLIDRDRLRQYSWTQQPQCIQLLVCLRNKPTLQACVYINSERL